MKHYLTVFGRSLPSGIVLIAAYRSIFKTIRKDFTVRTCGTRIRDFLQSITRLIKIPTSKGTILISTCTGVSICIFAERKHEFPIYPKEMNYMYGKTVSST